MASANLLPLEPLSGGYTIEWLACNMQPHYAEVLYVHDNILYIEPTIESCVDKLKEHGFELNEVMDNPNKTWVLKSNNAAEFWFFRQDIVDKLLK